MDSLMSLMQTQINRVISAATNDRVLPEIQNIMGILPLDQNGIRTGTSLKSKVSVMFEKTRIQKLQRKTQGPRVIIRKLLTLLLTQYETLLQSIN